MILINMVCRSSLILALILSTIQSSYCQNSGTFTDKRDQKIYRWVKIADQIWMAENLAYLPKVSPPSLGTQEESLVKPYYYVAGYFGTNISVAKSNKNYLLYGVLYNWIAAKSSCPSGWHLPSDEEWKKLEKFLGMPSKQTDENRFREDGKVGEKLKSSTGWKKGNGSNITQFSALPGGFRHIGDPLGSTYTGNFGYLGEEAFFWTSTIYREGIAYRRQLTSTNSGIVRFPQMVHQGYSVRCIKD